MIKASELRMKDVVNLIDGRRLGLIADFEVDLDDGRVTAIVVPGPGRILWFMGRDNDMVIPWEQIRKIGTDVILVELVSPLRA